MSVLKNMSLVSLLSWRSSIVKSMFTINPLSASVWLPKKSNLRWLRSSCLHSARWPLFNTGVWSVDTQRNIRRFWHECLPNGQQERTLGRWRRCGKKFLVQFAPLILFHWWSPSGETFGNLRSLILFSKSAFVLFRSLLLSQIKKFYGFSRFNWICWQESRKLIETCQLSWTTLILALRKSFLFIVPGKNRWSL